MKNETAEQPFEVMKWLRETRDRINEEIADMSGEELREWFSRRPTAPVLARMFDRRKAPTARGAQGLVPVNNRTPMEHEDEE